MVYNLSLAHNENQIYILLNRTKGHGIDDICSMTVNCKLKFLWKIDSNSLSGITKTIQPKTI